MSRTSIFILSIALIMFGASPVTSINFLQTPTPYRSDSSQSSPLSKTDDSSNAIATSLISSNTMPPGLFGNSTDPGSYSSVSATAGTLTVSGRFRFCESDSASSSTCTQRDLRQASVELWDDGSPQRRLSSAQTGSDGSYQFAPVTNSDPDGSTLDVFVRMVLDGSIVQVTNGLSAYNLNTTVHNNVPDGTLNLGTIVIGGTARGSAGIFDTIIKGYDYAKARGQTQHKVTVIWPASGTATAADGYTIGLVSGDEWDEDVILHEYTHSIQFQAYGGQFIPGSGGGHQWEVCNTQSTNPNNFGFSEGFPDFFGVATNFETGYGDTLYPKDVIYTDTVDYPFTANLETGVTVPATQLATGDCAEGSIALILWDMFDSTNDPGDTLSAGIAPIWATITHSISTLGHYPYNIHDFWDGWLEVCQTRSDCGTSPQAWAIFNAHGIQDTTPPSGSVSINNGAAYANSPSVTLSLTYSDALSRVYQVRYSNDGVFDTEAWETPAPTKAWTLTLGDGTKTVYYQVKDNAGLISSTFSDTIILDTTPPSGSISINNGAAYTSTPSVTLSLTYSDSLSGVSSVRYTNDGVFDTEPWESPSATRTWTLTAGDGTKTMGFQIRDNAGLTSTFSDTIILDTVPPSSSVLSLPAYSNPTFNVAWSGTDSLSGISRYDVQYRDVTANGPWSDLATGTSLTSTSFTGVRQHTYEFRSRATDQAGNQELFPATADASTSIPALLTADFTFSPSQPQPYETLTFTASYSGGGPPITFQWTFGDGYYTSSSSSYSSYTHYYSSSGTYTVTLVVSSSEGQSATINKQVVVVAAFQAPIHSSPLYPLVGSTVTLTADASGGVPPYRFLWTFLEDSTTATTNPVTRVYTSPGSYYVALDAYDSAGHGFHMIQPITVYALLTADFTVNTATPQVGETVTFTATASGGVSPLKFTWNFGDGLSGVAGNPFTHSYAAVGTYMVSLQVTSYDGQSATVTKSVNVVAVLSASFTYSPVSPIVGQPVTFTASASGGLQPYQFQWDFGDTGTGTGSQVTHTYPTSRSYHVVLTVSDGSSHTVTSSQDIIVNPVPLTVSFTYSPSAPTRGQTITFTATVSGGVAPYSFQWNFGDSTTGSGSQVTHVYANSGTYTVTVTVTDASARTATSSQNVVVSCGCGGGGSVAYGTLITMADGSKVAVQNLKVGDEMLGYDTSTGQFTVAIVKQMTMVDTSNMLVINTEAGIPFRVDANPAQTLWTKKSDGTIGWVPVTQLKVGDYLFQETMGWVKITSIQFAPQGNHVMFDIISTTPYFASGYLDPIYKM